MTILNPKASVWILLAVPIVVLYLRRYVLTRHSVATGFLWERIFPSDRVHLARRSAWWFVRHPASLCVQLGILSLLVFALEEPLLRRPLRLVLVIDNSASMNATDAQPTRLEEAKRLARPFIAALGYRDQMAIITAGDGLRVHCRLTSRGDTLIEALKAISVTNGTAPEAFETVSATKGTTRVVEAVALGRRLLGRSRAGRIVVLSDGCFDGAVELSRQGDVQWITVGGPGDNVGITRLSARRGPADPLQCQILVEVTSFSSEPIECRLKLELDGKPVDTVPIHQLAPAGRWQQVFEVTTAEGGQLTARVDRPDVFQDDNAGSVEVPDPRGQKETRRRWGSYLDPPYTSRLAGESDVRVPAGLVSRAETDVAGSSGPSLWLFPAAVALLLVAAEWHLFQRRWTC